MKEKYNLQKHTFLPPVNEAAFLEMLEIFQMLEELEPAETPEIEEGSSPLRPDVVRQMIPPDDLFSDSSVFSAGGIQIPNFQSTREDEDCDRA